MSGLTTYPIEIAISGPSYDCPTTSGLKNHNIFIQLPLSNYYKPVALLGIGGTKTKKTWFLPSKAHDLGEETHVNRMVRAWPRQLQSVIKARKTPDTVRVGSGRTWKRLTGGSDARIDSIRIMGVS